MKVENNYRYFYLSKSSGEFATLVLKLKRLFFKSFVLYLSKPVVLNLECSYYIGCEKEFQKMKIAP